MRSYNRPAGGRWARRAWSALTPPSVRVAVTVGFGATLAIWILTGYYFTHRITELESRSAAMNSRYLRAQELLTTARGQVLIATVYAWDAVLDPNRSSLASSRREVAEALVAADQAIQAYVPLWNAGDEQTRIDRLRSDIAELRSTLLPVLDSATGADLAASGPLLKREILPRRDSAIQVANELQSLNRSAFVHYQTEAGALYGLTERRLWESLGVALIASLGVALFAAFNATRLESRLRWQREKEAQDTRDLQRLSAQLVTAQEEERRTIARELHDEVGQVLTAIKVELAVAEHNITAAGGGTELLRDARNLADGALHTVRDLSQLLHPALLDDLGLPAAVEWYLKAFGRRHDIQVDVLTDHMDERLAAKTETTAYRIVQEALTNVSRHARATLCRVYLQRMPNTVLVTVEDNGCGFDPGDATRQGARRGLGLLGIHERASQLRGSVHLESAPGKGTRLTVELPI
jgi:signal transduction histidine kinase